MAEITLELAQVPDGGAAVLEAGGRLRLAVFRVGDRIAVIDDRCPHAGASLGRGSFDGTTVQCPLHGFRVDVWRGIGNGNKRVRTFAATVVGDRICIALPE